MFNVGGVDYISLGGPGNPSIKSLHGSGFRAYPMAPTCLGFRGLGFTV